MNKMDVPVYPSMSIRYHSHIYIICHRLISIAVIYPAQHQARGEGDGDRDGDNGDNGDGDGDEGRMGMEYNNNYGNRNRYYS